MKKNRDYKRPVTHPCLCGFIHDPQDIGGLVAHRRGCEIWRNRPDPKGLFLFRQRMTRQQRKYSIFRCLYCKGPVDCHYSWCINSFVEDLRLKCGRRVLGHDLFDKFAEVFRKHRDGKEIYLSRYCRQRDPW